MSTDSNKLVLVGDSLSAEVAYYYFTEDSPYEVVGFTVERDYLKKEEMFGLPVVALEDVENHFAPDAHAAYVAAVYTQLNRLRTRLAGAMKRKGYRLASFVSSRATVASNAQIGEHTFVFEENTIQPFVTIGSNVILWSGNHVGHHSRIKDNVFMASHVVVSGSCVIGDNCFLGVNSTIADGVNIADDCWIGPGVLITQDTEENSIYRIKSPEPARISARRYFKADAK